MTTSLTDRPPSVLAAALLELDRRCGLTWRAIADASAAQQPCVVVINEAPSVLWDSAVRAAAERIAAHGPAVNVTLELRGTPLVPQLADFGGSTMLQNLAGDPTVTHVHYQCMRPLPTVPLNALQPGHTRVRHADPAVRASGRPDDGVLTGWDPDRHGGAMWATVLFTGDAEPSRVLARDVLVVVDPQ